jgi:exosortase/archaeosortase family protein
MNLRSFNTWMTSRAAAVAALCLASWPVARWYVARISDGSDEPWGLAALAAAMVFAPRTGWTEPLTRFRTWILCGVVAAYTTTYAFIPPLGHAFIFVTAIGIAASRLRFPLAWWSLLVLSLPLVATLQFYLGYPLRLAATVLCVPLLQLGGLHVMAEGTALHWAGETVIVDAPCSGIHMLWTGLFLAAALACWQRLDTRQTFRLLRCASLAVFAANVLRAAALFCIESKIWPSPAWAHEGVGLTLFGAAAMAISRASETQKLVTPARLSTAL